MTRADQDSKAPALFSFRKRCLQGLLERKLRCLFLDQVRHHGQKHVVEHLDLESMLDLECTLPVSHLRIAALLDLLAADDRPALSLILLRFAVPDRRDCRRAVLAAPWLKDIPHAERALEHLCCHGWSLIGCGHREQGLALWKSVRRRRGILVSRYDLGS